MCVRGGDEEQVSHLFVFAPLLPKKQEWSDSNLKNQYQNSEGVKLLIKLMNGLQYAMKQITNDLQTSPI